MALNASGIEAARSIVSGSFTATGSGQPFRPRINGSSNAHSVFAASVSGTFVGTVVLERTVDNGTTWQAVSVNAAGDANAFTKPCDLDVDAVEPGEAFRWNCTVFTSGTIVHRLAQ